MKTAFTQENDLWQQLQKNTDPTDQQRQLLEFIRLLLEQSQCSPTEISQLDHDDLTDLFLEYQGIGKITADFLREGLPFLDPSYQGQDFEQQLHRLQQELQDFLNKNQQLQQAILPLQQLSTELQQQQAHYAAQEEELHHLRRYIAQLEQQQQQAQRAPEQIAQLRQQATQESMQALQTLLRDWLELMTVIKENAHHYQAHYQANQNIHQALQQLPELNELGMDLTRLGEMSAQLNTLLGDYDRHLNEIMAMEEKHRQLLRALREPRANLTRPEDEE
ncbi:hypothetical protein [Thioflexithrix psekupsensis]|jgi:chromosome segregation ATPase|uniref:Uncharacterized protein n=1 Tax=Thioflexithrix psekupsensis TaxID=1570016 RepID=A0A251X6Q0_9GAMM|nr:hypothetical protein [Thioflexithrix psekupsensis]OUD13292.1 hypothetical protein TPSD3_11725 [Thioflexithrix psekupsensis]